MEDITVAEEKPVAKRSRRTGVVLLLVGVLVILVAAGGWYLYNTKGGAFKKVERVQKEAFSLGLAPLPLYTLSEDKQSLLPLTVNYGGKEAVSIVDLAHVGNYVNEILITDPPAFVSQVFKKEANGERTALTSSKTYKYDMTVANDGTIVYLSGSIASTKDFIERRTWDVMMLKEGKEIKIGTGSKAWILADGSHVLFVSGAEVKSAQVGTEKITSLLSIATSTPVAVDTESGFVSAVNPTTRAVDLFVKKNESLGYEKSFTIATSSGPLTALAMFEKDPIVSFARMEGETTILSFTNLATGKSSTARIPATPFLPARLTFLP